MRPFSGFAGLMTLMLVLQGAIMTTSQSTAQQQPQWVRLAEHAAFAPRDTAEDAVFLGKMWISNAYGPGGVLIRDLWNSTDGVTWTKVLDETPYGSYSEMTVYQDKLWAIKGSVWNTADGTHASLTKEPCNSHDRERPSPEVPR